MFFRQEYKRSACFCLSENCDKHTTMFSNKKYDQDELLASSASAEAATDLYLDTFSTQVEAENSKKFIFIGSISGLFDRLANFASVGFEGFNMLVKSSLNITVAVVRKSGAVQWLRYIITSLKQPNKVVSEMGHEMLSVKVPCDVELESGFLKKKPPDTQNFAGATHLNPDFWIENEIDDS